MDSTTPSSLPSSDGARPDEEGTARRQRATGPDDTAASERTPGPKRAVRRQDSPPAQDVLGEVATTITDLEMSDAGRALLAQVLSATLIAFTRTSSVRDPLPDTASDSPEEALAVLAGLDHLHSSLAAMGATWQVAAEQRIRQADRSRGVATKDQGRGAAQEIALARRVSPAASSFSLASARRLVQHMPGTVDLLWEGALTAEQATTVASALDGASPATCARIDEMIHEDPQSLQGKGRKRLRSVITQLVQRLEPETSRDRAERAARRRHVTMTPLADGMARVTAVLRVIDAAGMMQSLNSRAQSLRAAGEKTSVPALEADLLVDAVRAQNDRPDVDSRPPRPTPGLDVGIVITDTALLAGDDEEQCAQLEGYGTLPAHIVTDTLRGRPPGHLRRANQENRENQKHEEDGEERHPDEEVSAFYRRLYAAPRRGELVAMDSQARAFPAGLARLLRWRDTTCRTPWCNAQIRHSDHVVPVHRGGETSYANGQGLCVRCNLLKEHGLWEITAQDPGAPGSPDGTATPDGTGPTGAPARPTPDAPQPPTSTRPPAAWHWRSPHGAQGVSTTPRLLPPPPHREPEKPQLTEAHDPSDSRPESGPAADEDHRNRSGPENDADP